jgi:hypothetical protein
MYSAEHMEARSFCPKKCLLLDSYRQAVATYSDALSRLHASMTTLAKSEYDQLYRMGEAVRLHARAVREDLERHTKSHGC